MIAIAHGAAGAMILIDILAVLTVIAAIAARLILSLKRRPPRHVRTRDCCCPACCQNLATQLAETRHTGTPTLPCPDCPTEEPRT